MALTSNHRNWITVGTLFGYPICCIKAFEDNVQVKSSKLFGTGFTQCENCNRDMSLTNVIDTIHKNRKVPFIFPFTSDVRENKFTVVNLSIEFKEAFYEYYGKTVSEVAVNPTGNYSLDRQADIDSQILKVAKVLRNCTTLPLEKIMVKAKVLVARYNKEPALKTKYTLVGFVRYKLLLKSEYSPAPVLKKKELDT